MWMWTFAKVGSLLRPWFTYGNGYQKVEGRETSRCGFPITEAGMLPAQEVPGVFFPDAGV
jgi:hypothetical protein